MSWRPLLQASDAKQYEGDYRDDMFDSKQMKHKKKVQETDSDKHKKNKTGIGRQR